MATTQAELVKQLVDAGIHFGHPASRWCPKMEPYIHGKRGAVHIIDVRETVKGLLRCKKLVQNVVASGKDVVFVGTKRQARTPVINGATKCGMHYVAERWLGGTLTNFRTIRARLSRLDELDNLWETGEIETFSKKMKSTLGRERKKIKTNLEGIRGMEKMPGLMFIVDVRREHIAVKEAKKLGVMTAALIDTDSDPDMVDLPIPGNDDAMKAIDIIMDQLADAAIEGKKGRTAGGKDSEGQRGERGRSSRSSFRADAGGQSAAPTSPLEPGGDPAAASVASPEVTGSLADTIAAKPDDKPVEI